MAAIEINSVEGLQKIRQHRSIVDNKKIQNFIKFVHKMATTCQFSVNNF